MAGRNGICFQQAGERAVERIRFQVQADSFGHERIMIADAIRQVN